MPWKMLLVKQKEVEMKRSYNHIKHLVDNHGIITSINGPLHWQDAKHEANQLDGKQHHAGFDYDEYDVPEFAPPD